MNQHSYGGSTSYEIPNWQVWRDLLTNEDWDDLEHFVIHTEDPSMLGLVYTLKEICQDDKFPPRSLVRRILAKAASLGKRDCSGVTSEKYVALLHSICRMGSLRSLKVFLNWCSDSPHFSIADKILTYNDAGENAFDVMWGELIDWELDAGQDLSHIDPSRLKTKFRKMLDLTTTLVASWKITEDLPEHELHRIVVSPSPSVATWVALQLYPTQVRDKDMNGDLPLHLAASNVASHVCMFFQEMTDLQYLSDTRSSLQILLDAYPQAARIPDRNGRFAVNLAIENYRDWKQINERRWYTRQMYCIENDIPVVEGENTSFHSMIVDLVKAAPGALCARDVETHLYPCMLASSCTLDLIYSLVRIQPEVISRCVQRTEYELYLQAKVETLRDDQKNLRDERDDLEEQRDELAKERDELLQRLEFFEKSTDGENSPGNRKRKKPSP